MGRDHLHQPRRAPRRRSYLARDGRLPGATLRPAAAAAAGAAVAGDSFRRPHRRFRHHDQADAGRAHALAQGTQDRRQGRRGAVRRPARLPRQGQSLPDVSRARGGAEADQGQGSPRAGRLVRQRPHREGLQGRRQEPLPVGDLPLPRRPRPQGARRHLVGRRFLHLAGRQHPGDVRPFAGRGDGGRPAGRCVRLGRLSRDGAARRGRRPDPHADVATRHRRTAGRATTPASTTTTNTSRLPRSMSRSTSARRPTPMRH